MRRAIRGLSSVLIIAGALLVLDAVLTVVWQEPLSALYASIKQDQLSGQLGELDQRPPSAAERRVLAVLADAGERMAFLARRLRAESRPGQPIGRIRIPHIGADFVVVEGTDESSLQKGPGHYPSTPLPGMGNTIGVAGHRTTYLAPFRHVDRLRAGNAIVVEMPYGRFTYTVQATRIVLPTDVGVVRPVGYERLVLSACHPLYSASHRIIVFARLTSAQPAGAALIGAPPGTASGLLRPRPTTTLTAPPLGPAPRRLAPAARG